MIVCVEALPDTPDTSHQYWLAEGAVLYHALTHPALRRRSRTSFVKETSVQARCWVLRRVPQTSNLEIRLTRPLQTMRISPKDAECSMILVMGVTGSGKSYFINKLAQDAVAEGHKLRSSRFFVLALWLQLLTADRDDRVPSGAGWNWTARSRAR